MSAQSEVRGIVIPFTGKEWSGVEPQLNLFDYRKVPKGAFGMPSEKEPPKYRTRADVADMVGINVATVDRHTKPGPYQWFHGTKFGRLVRYEESQLQRDCAKHNLPLKQLELADSQNTAELPESLKATG